MKYSTAIKEQVDLTCAKISNIEQRMINGDKTVTMFNLMAETHKLLAITKPVEKYHNTNTNQNLWKQQED